MKRLACILALALMIVPGRGWGGTYQIDSDSIATSANVHFPVSGGRFKIALSDTAFSGIAGASAKRIIVGRLDDPATTWNYAEFTQRAKSTSWWAANGAQPVSYAITITTGQDTLIVKDREKATTYRTIVKAANNGLGNSVFNDVKGLDGRTYVATSSGLYVIDYLRDKIYLYSTSGLSIYNGNISQANSAFGYTLLNGGAGYRIIDNTVNAIAVIRDPDGGVDEFGRLKQLWVVETSLGGSAYIPSSDNIYDMSVTTLAMLEGFLLDDGNTFWIENHTSKDYLLWKYALQTAVADGWWAEGGVYWGNDSAGSQDLPWTNAAVFSQVSAVPNASIAGNNSPLVILGSSEGLAFLHTKRNNNTNGSNIFINATRNSPPGKGSAVIMWAAEDTVDSSPYANNLTRAGTGTSVTFTTDGAVGKAAYVDSTANGHLVRLNDTDFRRGTASWSIGIAVKSAYATNPSANRFVYNLRTTLDSIELLFNSSGQLVAQTSDDGTAYDTITFAQDVHDALWHWVEYSRDGSTFRLRVDGEEVGTIEATNVNTAVDPDTLFVGKNTGAALAFVGYVDEFTIDNVAVTAQTSRYAYGRILRGIQSTTDPADALPGTSDSVRSVYVDPRSGYVIVSGAADTITVFDEFAIPVQKWGGIGGTVNDVKVFTEAGSDSFSVYIATSTRTRWIQQDLKISELAQGNQNVYESVRHEARYVINPADSGTVYLGGITITSADSQGTFKYANTTKGNVRVGLNAEVRGSLRYGSASAVGADIAEMFAVQRNDFRVVIGSANPNLREVFLPPLVRLKSITVMDNDSTRLYQFKCERAENTQRARLFLDVAVKGRIGRLPTDVVYVRGVEVGDFLQYRVDSLTVARLQVVGVCGDTVSLVSSVPAGTEYTIVPPELLVQFTGPLMRAGDVVQFVAPKTVGLSTKVGKRGWIVSTSPANVLNADLEGVPVALIGSVPCNVAYDAVRGAIAVGDPLTAGVGGVAVKALSGELVLGWAMEVVSSGRKLIGVLLE